MQLIKFEVPTHISEINKHTGNIKTYFGRGTGAGKIHCCKCQRCVGHLMDLEEDYIVGHIDLVCNRCNETIDYSMVNTLTLNYNVIPSWICQKERDRKEQLRLCDAAKSKYINQLFEYYGKYCYEYIPHYEMKRKLKD